MSAPEPTADDWDALEALARDCAKLNRSKSCTALAAWLRQVRVFSHKAHWAEAQAVFNREWRAAKGLPPREFRA